MTSNIFEGLYNQTAATQAPTLLTGPQIRLVDANGDYVGSANASDLDYFSKQGYRPETAEEKVTNDYLQENNGIGGALKTFGYNAANELSLGALNPIVEGSADKSTIAKIHGLQREHNIAGGLGSVAGVAGSMLLPGIGEAGLIGDVGRLGEGAEALAFGGRAAEGLGGKIIRGAIKQGVEGAALAAPQALSEASFGDPQEAAEHLLYGLGAGAVFGATSPVLKGMGKTLINAVGAPIGYRMEEGLTKDVAKMSENQAVRSLFTNQNKQLMGEVNKLGKEGINLGRYVLDNNIVPNVGEDTTSYLQRALEHKQEAGSQVGQVVDMVRDIKAVNTDELISKMRKEIEPLAESAAKKTEYQQANKYIDDFEEKLKSFDGSTAMEQNEVNKLELIKDPVQRETQLKVLDGLKNQLLEENSNVTLGKIWKEQSDLGNKIFKEKAARLGNPNALNEELQSLRNVIKDTIKEKGSEIAKSNGIENWTKQFDLANKNYRAASLITDIAENSANAASNRNFSLTDNIWGSAIGAGNIAHLASNPLGLIAGVGGSIASKFLRENGNKLISQYGNKASLYLALIWPRKKHKAN